MTKYKKTCIIFFMLMVLFAVMYAFAVINFWWILLPVLFFKAAVIWGSANIQSNFFTQVLCAGETGRQEIAITFDDGPDPNFTKPILDTLDEFDAKATFFVIGKRIKGCEDILKSIDSRGHTIGNHTYTHSFFIDFRSFNGFKEEIGKTAGLVYDITGRRLQLFRPPYGVTTPAIARACKVLGYHLIGWNIRSLDTTSDSEETIAKRVIGQIRPGAVILFHDTSEKTHRVLRQVLQYARQNGIRIVPVNELLNISKYNQ